MGIFLLVLMSLKKGLQDHDMYPGSRAFGLLYNALDCLEMEFSTKHNAKWGLKAVTSMSGTMSIHSICANQASEMLNDKPIKKMAAPTGQWFLSKVQSVDQSEVEEKCNAMLRSTVTDAVATEIDLLQKEGRPAILAMDGTKIPRHDENPDMNYLINSRSDSGTTVFEEHETTKLLSVGGAAVYTARCTMAKDGNRADNVRKMLKESVDLGILPMLGKKRSIVLLDRGYYSVNVMSVINNAGFAFIMPAVKNAKIKAAIKEYARGERPAVSQHIVKSSEGKEFAFWLIINRNPKKAKSKNIVDRYYVFATTLRCRSYKELKKYVPRKYRNRWDIETGYRCVKSARPKTTSRNPVVRLILFYISLVIYNIWMIIRILNNQEAGKIKLIILLSQMNKAACYFNPQDVADKPKSGLKREPG